MYVESGMKPMAPKYMNFCLAKVDPILQAPEDIDNIIRVWRFVMLKSGEIQ